MMKNILIIAFAYPPYNSGSGWLRAYNFSKYLPEYGWKPHILTVKENAYDYKDNTFAIPEGASITRTKCYDIKKIMRGRYPAFMAFPDRYASWLPFGLIEGLRIVKRTSIKIIFSTYQIPTAHLIALDIKKRTSLPWIADFRDPWIEDYVSSSSLVMPEVQVKLEKSVVESADVVLLTTTSLKNYFLKRYNYLPPDKFKVIYNGYEENYFAGLLSEKHYPFRRVFEIVHTGAMNDTFRNPVPVFKAVMELLAEDFFNEKEVKITFIGSGEYGKSSCFLNDIRKHGLEKVVQVSKRLNYEDCIKYMAKADILLLLQYSAEVELLVPAKAFEYLRIGRPILSIVDDGETKDLISSCNAGWAIKPDNIEAIKKAIIKAFTIHQHKKRFELKNKEKIKMYSREYQTGILAQVLNDVLESGGLD